MKTISCQIGTDMLIYNSVVEDLPACRNGRRGRLKICCGQPRMGSSPIAGSYKKPQTLDYTGVCGFLPFKNLITPDYYFDYSHHICANFITTFLISYNIFCITTASLNIPFT